MDCSLPRLLCLWNFPDKNTGVGCHFLLQGIFPTQGLNPSPMHWQSGSSPLSHQGSPNPVTYKHWLLHRILWHGHSSVLRCGLTMGWLLESSCSGTQVAGATPNCSMPSCGREQKHASQAMYSPFNPLLGNGVHRAPLEFYWTKQATWPNPTCWVLRKEEVSACAQWW